MSDLLIHVARRAMACEFEVQFPADRYPRGAEAALEALDRVEALEEEISYFRPSSQLSRINVLASEGPVEVAPSLFELLALAMRVYEQTGGAYDITATPLWELWGFARCKGEIPDPAAIEEARTRVAGHLVELDPSRRTVRFCRPGVRLNLGSIGKGCALDLCAKHLLAFGVNDFLIHGGQSSVLAYGSQADGRPWEIGIRRPDQPNRRIGVVRLENRALGTSSDQFQSFRHHGRRYGHILDPRSGVPAQGVLSATVVASSGALADALSTAFYVMGPDAAMDFCKNHPEVGAVLLCPDSQGSEPRTFTAGLGSLLKTV